MMKYIIVRRKKDQDWRSIREVAPPTSVILNDHFNPLHTWQIACQTDKPSANTPDALYATAGMPGNRHS